MIKPENFDMAEYDEPQCEEFYGEEDDETTEMTDVEADADTLASAGFGMDEDYGCYGERE